MQRVLEVMFSRWLQLVVLFAAPVLIAGGIVLTQPRQYEASAAILALRRYEVVGATGAETDLSATPATTQTTALSELLQTRAFDLTIARDTGLSTTFPASVQSNPDALTAAIVNDLSAHVIATPVGYQIISVTYANRSRAIARKVVSAVVEQYGIFASQFAVSESNQLLLIYQDELKQAQATSTNATTAAATYLRNHPGATPQHDPVYSDLQTSATNAQATVATIQSQIDQINHEVATIGTDSNTLFKVVDPATAAYQPVSRTKVLFTGGAIGLAVGILFSIIFVIVLLRRDRSVYSVADLQKITEAPILMQIPQMPPRLLAQTLDRLDAIEQFF